MAQAMARGTEHELHSTLQTEEPQTITAEDLDVDVENEAAPKTPEEERVEGTAFAKRAQSVVRAYNDRVAGWNSMDQLPEPHADMGIMGTVRLIGGAVVGIAVITLVVNQVLSINSIANSTGPFSGVIASLETTGVAAMTLLVVGLVVAAASAIMSFMGSGF